MPHDARAIANTIINIAETEEILVSHLSLQKILYFAHAWFLAKYKDALIGQQFQAWKFGPVQKVVYDQLKGTKSNLHGVRLVSFDLDTQSNKPANAALSDEERSLLIDIVKYYGAFHAGQLVDLTHETGGPWDRVWKKAGERAHLGMMICNNDIREWFLSDKCSGSTVKIIQ